MGLLFYANQRFFLNVPYNIYFKEGQFLSQACNYLTFQGRAAYLNVNASTHYSNHGSNEVEFGKRLKNL
jgi:hypothetical protein